MANKIPKLNANNEVVGETTIAEAKANGWPRRISRIFLFDGAGNILLQKRGPSVHSFPNMWDQAAGGHVDVGEDYQGAAIRELEEELGIIDCPLTEIAVDYQNKDCFEGIYKGQLAKHTTFSLDAHEVSEVRWFTITEFESMAADSSPELIPQVSRVWYDFKEQFIS